MRVFGDKRYSLTIMGDVAFQTKLAELATINATAFNRALVSEAKDILDEAKVIVPVDTGTLDDSGKIAFGREGEDFVAAAGFGDNTTNPKSRAKTWEYARYQHETNVKYLEIPFMRAIAGMIGRIARKMKVGGSQ
jgi:hypothetical protein